MKVLHAGLRALVPAVAAATLLACDDFLNVTNPNVIDSRNLDLEHEADLLTKSAVQEWATAYGWMVLHSAWFTHEAWTADTDVFENTVNRRDIDPMSSGVPGRIGTHLRPVSRAIALADRVLIALGDRPDASRNINVARAYFTSGYALIWMGENFCQGVINAGAPMTPVMVLDSAVARLERAREVALGAASSLTGALEQEAMSIAHAARVGEARAHLQAGRPGAALAAAELVPTGFVYDVRYQRVVGISDLRIANMLYVFSYDNRRSVSVAPAFRDLNDPRVPVRAPQDHGLLPFDGVTALWLQAKYTGFNSPIRLASRLEADYITAEAQGTDAMLALSQARRSAVGLQPYTGPTDPQSILVEFMDQRSREFFMEGKRLGDSRRHPDAVSHIPATGSPYHKTGYGNIGSQTCWPLPQNF